MPDYSLLCHPSTPDDVCRAIDVRVQHLQTDRLELRYHVVADPSALKLPEQRAAERTDGLWQHTCFEAFVRPMNAEPYYELNFSPSTQWAAYRFESYRAGRTDAVIATPEILTRRREAELVCDVQIDLRSLQELHGRALQLGLSAVIESASGARSYWALCHPSAQPDFHHAAAFCAAFEQHA